MPIFDRLFIDGAAQFVIRLRRWHVRSTKLKAIVRNPTEGIYRATDDYVHAIEVQGANRLLFVSGTMGLDVNGVPGKTVDAQLQLIWANIRTISATSNMSVDNIVRLSSYLTDGAYAEANARARVAALGGRVIPTTAIIVKTLVSEWLVEIEIIAAA
jgi:2-iminobutanoate/2-iminopropanoate deaminase